jgi:hypothetical protein
VDSVQVFVGFDSSEEEACRVCAYSIQQHNPNLNPLFLNQKALRAEGIYTRPIDKMASTEFSLTRFLTPYLSKSMYAIFCDGDFVFRSDVSKVLDEIDTEAVVSCVHHDYLPKHEFKMGGKSQHRYAKKNWSSFMVFNTEKARNILTPNVVNESDPAYLHQFKWAEPESLHKKWNHLVGEYEKDDSAIGIHFTNGGPWHGIETEWDDVWQNYRNNLMKYQTLKYIRGLSAEEALREVPDQAGFPWSVEWPTQPEQKMTTLSGTITPSNS